MLHNIRTRGVQEIKQKKHIFMKIFLSVIAHKYKWKYKISEYHIVWGTPWFLMRSSHWVVAKFLLPLGISRKYRIAHVKKDLCFKVTICTRSDFVCMKRTSWLCAMSHLTCAVFSIWNDTQADAILWFIKRNQCWNDQGATTFDVEKLWKTVSWHQKEHHGRLFL